MNWYMAKFVFRIICGDGQHAAQFDEQLRLIEAESQREAFEKAATMGRNEEESFYNRKNQLVQWQFVNISEIYLLNDLTDGIELYSRIEEKDNAEPYIYTVNQKAQNLFNQDYPAMKLA